MEDKNTLGTAPVGRLMVKLAVPAIVAQLVNALYNIVDRIYIGHIEEVGDIALTGLGLCFPILMLVSALAALLGVGGGSRAAICMGEGDTGAAERILGNCAAMTLVISAVVTVLLQAVKTPMLYLFGASGNTIGYAQDYLGVYLWGTLFVQVALGLNNFITTQGFSAFSMATVLIGAGINIVLDPVFIFGLDMGVRGAALATVIAQGASAVWVLAFLLGKRTKLKLRPGYFRLEARVLLPVAAIGVSPFIMQSTESLVNICFNASLSRYGGDSAVGAMTICSSVMMVMSMIFQGLAQGAQPIVGYNYGAGALDRVKKAFRLLFISGVAYALAGWGLLQLFPQVFVGMFNDKPELVEIGVWALKIYTGCFFMMGVQFSCQQTFVALGQARTSLFLALLRKIILLIPLIFLLPHVVGAFSPALPGFANEKVFGVFLAEPVADFLAAATTGTIFFTRFPGILARRAAELEGR